MAEEIGGAFMTDGTIYKRLGVKPGDLIYFLNGHENFFRKVKAYMPEGG